MVCDGRHARLEHVVERSGRGLGSQLHVCHSALYVSGLGLGLVTAGLGARVWLGIVTRAKLRDRGVARTPHWCLATLFVARRLEAFEARWICWQPAFWGPGNQDYITPDENFHTWVCHYSHDCARRLDSTASRLGSGSVSGFGDHAVTASECYFGCKEAGYGCGVGVGLLDHYYGCCRALSCMQTCMMRVSGVSYQSCVDKVYEVSNADANRCSVVVDRREYDFCGAYDQSTCEVQPTMASGLKGCEIGEKPDISQIDPFCWVYNEDCKQFEPYGHASIINLI